MAALALELFDLRSPLTIRLLTTVLLAFIGIFGYLRGLHGLEALEKIAVNAKLSIIGALVIVLASSNLFRMGPGAPTAELGIPEFGVDSLRILGGMLLITQGFETTRYLGRDYTRQERARALFLAQIIAAIIYILCSWPWPSPAVSRFMRSPKSRSSRSSVRWPSACRWSSVWRPFSASLVPVWRPGWPRLDYPGGKQGTGSA